MRLLQIHNKYQFAGGEDVVAENERQLLSEKGHDVILLVKDNKEIELFTAFQKLSLLWKTTWSNTSYYQVIDQLKKIQPDICHVHNFFPLFSPAIYYACDELGIPVVQTLHNYRLLCTNAYLFRNGHVCEECLGRTTYHSVQYGCYRDSHIQSYAVARMIEKNRNWGTWDEKIDAYICLTQFSKQKFIQGGFSNSKIYVKQNYLPIDPGISENQGEYFLFAGRLDETKGLKVLLDATTKLSSTKFVIAGDGPLRDMLLKQNLKNIDYKGRVSREQMDVLIRNCIALVFPSIWYECMPMSIIEAFANGKPVIASKLGALEEIVKDGETGLLFEPNNTIDLESKLKWALTHRKEIDQMGKNARKEFELKYTKETNYPILMNIYDQAKVNRQKSKQKSGHS